jgi:uncharacterized membrane protein (DUF485 family)
MFPVILILYFVIVGLTADKLHLAQEVSKEIVVSRGQVLSLLVMSRAAELGGWVH